MVTDAFPPALFLSMLLVNDNQFGVLMINLLDMLSINPPSWITFFILKNETNNASYTTMLLVKGRGTLHPSVLPYKYKRTSLPVQRSLSKMRCLTLKCVNQNRNDLLEATIYKNWRLANHQQEHRGCWHRVREELYHRTVIALYFDFTRTHHSDVPCG